MNANEYAAYLRDPHNRVVDRRAARDEDRVTYRLTVEQAKELAAMLEAAFAPPTLVEPPKIVEPQTVSGPSPTPKRKATKRSKKK